MTDLESLEIQFKRVMEKVDAMPEDEKIALAARGSKAMSKDIQMASEIANSAIHFCASRAEMAEVPHPLIILMAAKLFGKNREALLNGDGPYPVDSIQWMDKMLDQCMPDEAFIEEQSGG